MSGRELERERDLEREREVERADKNEENAIESFVEKS